MSHFVQRTYYIDCFGDLKDEINDNVTITTELLQIVYDGVSDSFFEFVSEPPAPEITELDNILATFTCPVDTTEPVDTQDFSDDEPSDPNVIWSSDKIETTFVPLTTTITGDKSVSGGGDLTANRTLELVNDQDTPGNTKVYGTNGSGVKGWYDAASGTTVDETQIIYVGKHGNDGNDGKTIDKAVLTFGQAITLCNAQTPTVSSQWGVVCFDNGSYSEDIAITTPYVRIFAANAILEGKITLANHTSFEFESLFYTAGGNAVEMVSGTNTAYGEIKHLKIDSSNGVVNNSSGILNVEIEYLQQTGGIGIINSSILHADIQDWDVYGTSPTLVRTTGGMTNVRSANHSDRGGSGTSLGYDCDAGITNIFVIRACPDQLYDVESGATLNLMVIETCGVTRENNGTVNELETSHASDTSIHFTEASINITESQISDFGSYLTDAPSNGSEYVRKDGSWEISSGGGSVGGTSKQMNTWTILSGSLYYNDFIHNLATDEITVMLFDTVSNQSVRPEYVEIIDTNTVRVVVDGNAEDLTCNVVSGNGPAGPQGPAGPGDVSSASTIGDHSIVRGDGGVKGVQGSNWSITDDGLMTAGFSRTGYILDVHNTLGTGGGNGFAIKAGEALGDIAFHVADADDTFQIMEMEADQGHVTMGKTYAQTLTDNGVVYGLDNQHGPGASEDFNTQNGTYRVAGDNAIEQPPTTDLTGAGTIVPATIDTSANGIGTPLYMAADGNFDSADADAAATMPCRAIALETGIGAKKVLLRGFIKNSGWTFTPGGDVYVSTTIGTVTQTVPSGTGDQVQKIGFAWSADTLYFSPGDYTVVEVA